jgi:hypothetical protein
MDGKTEVDKRSSNKKKVMEELEPREIFQRCLILQSVQLLFNDKCEPDSALLRLAAAGLGCNLTEETLAADTG